MKKILFYVDSFGLGHITREIALARAIGDNAEIIFASNDHLEFIEKSLPSIKTEKTSLGLNLIPEGIGLNVEETKKANKDFIGKFETNIESETKRIDRLKPDVIIADIPAEPLLAAEKSGIPIVAISNFGWTAIIEHVFGKDSDEYKKYSEAYSNASKTLVLPFSEPMRQFSNKKRVGLLRRRITRNLGKIPGIIATFGKSGEVISAGTFFRFIPDEVIESQDYVASADAIFSKPSYGIASEAISAGIPLFLKKRNDFPESDHILRQLEGAMVVPEWVDAMEFIEREMKNLDIEAIERMRDRYMKNSDSEIAETILDMC